MNLCELIPETSVLAQKSSRGYNVVDGRAKILFSFTSGENILASVFVFSEVFL